MLVLRRPLLGGTRHRDARVLPLLFERMPAVEHELGAQLLLGQHLAHHPVCLASGVLGTGIEEDGGTIDGHGDAVTELTADVVCSSCSRKDRTACWASASARNLTVTRQSSATTQSSTTTVTLRPAPLLTEGSNHHGGEQQSDS